MDQIRIFIYVLELEKGKYYVGQSSQPMFRFAQHIDFGASKWTKLFKAKKMVVCEEKFVDTACEAKLLENWTTLHWMQKKGWRNIRGGDYLKVEDYMLEKDICHIFDTETNKIRYFVESCRYLFGISQDYIIYILELKNGKYYIGSTQRLGRDLGKHFLGNGIDWTKANKPVRVLEYYTVPHGSSHVEEKLKRLKEHVDFYGMENVRGGNFEPKKTREPISP